VDACGHRVVHGRELFSNSALVTRRCVRPSKSASAIAPLHNPPNLAGIAACEKIFPGLPQVRGLRTPLSTKTMPPHVYTYGPAPGPARTQPRAQVRLPRYVSRVRGSSLCRADEEGLHQAKNHHLHHLGNGSSITAVKHGQSFDTSMGLTPLEGLLMGTRTGDMDPAVVLYIMDKDKLSPQEMNTLLNSKSGVKGCVRCQQRHAPGDRKGKEGDAGPSLRSTYSTTGLGQVHRGVRGKR